ncbi:MAG: PAS domain-containing protein, partial [bacterium]
IAGNKQEFTMECTCHSATEKRWFLSKVTRFYIADEIFLVITNENITDRKLAEEALAKGELQLRSLVEANVIGVICWYLDGRITKANNAFLKMVGYTQEDLATGKINWRDLTPPEYHELDEQAVKQLKENRHCSPLEKEYFCKNGSRIPVLIAGTMFFNSSDEGICYVLDLRKQKMLQAQLIQAQKMESIGTLASGIAHDLNNILTPVLVFIQLLKRKLPEAKDLKIMNALETTVQRGSDLVRQILSLTRKTETDSVKINFRKLLAEIELLMRETFPRSININIDMARDLATVIGNNTEVHQVILNLCINARDAMPNGGVLNIVVENIFIDDSYTLRNSDACVGEYVVIAISDTGSGISVSNINKIFTPFFTTKGCEKGTGLGLSIVLDIIKKHGGFITVNSNSELTKKYSKYLSYW